MDHTYINNPSCFTMASTADVPDMDFLTDANVYYNLPPPPPSAASHRSSLSLPRGHLTSHQMSSSSSCPPSPKLPPGVVPRKGNFTPPRYYPSDRVGKTPVLNTGSKASLTLPSGQEGAKAVTPGANERTPPLVKKRSPKAKNKKLVHARSFDLDHLYQNLVRVASKPRSNSFSVPWRRKKKNVAAAAAGIEEEDPANAGRNSSARKSEEGASGISAPSISNNGSPLSQSGVRSCKTTSSSSSSSDSDTQSEDLIEDYSAEVCPGVTYIRENALRNQTETHPHEDSLNSWYHTAATLPLRETKPSRNSQHVQSGSAIIRQERRTIDIATSLEEWRRKERWFEKKRSSRNPRLAEESGEVHIVILYAEDSIDWKNYLYELFTQMVPKEDGCQAVRVEVKNVEEIEDSFGGLQAVKLKDARLQIVVISPRFMSHIAGHGRSEIGQLFEPGKVLGLLLGVDDYQFSMAHLSALYSYKDWHRLKVRNSDLSFIEEVLSEAINILNNSRLYTDYPDERGAKFRVTSRKVTMLQKQFYILLNEEMTKTDDVEVLIEAPGRPATPVTKWQEVNPYTICFTMPDEFLKSSSLLQVSMIVNGVGIGSRQLKCESNMDTLRDILASVSNPTELMCQALNINPLSEDLDQKLADRVKLRLPLTRIEDSVPRKAGGEFPTWIHFSAYYGLERLTWTLLEIPGAEEALNIPNCNGQAPSVLAYQRGFYSLAQKLEDATLVSTLANSVCGLSNACGEEFAVKEASSSTETYNSPPPPRPVVSPLNSSTVPNYDPLPVPRVVDPAPPLQGDTEPIENASSSIVSNLLQQKDSECKRDQLSANELSPPSVINHPLSPVSIRHKTKTDEKQMNCYLDMNMCSVDRHGKLYEYSEDVYTLVKAWNERTDIKAFVEINQDKIDEMKKKLENTQHQLDFAPSCDDNDTLPAVPEENNRFSDGSLHQKTVVDKFLSLLYDTYSEGESKYNTSNSESTTGQCAGELAIYISPALKESQDTEKTPMPSSSSASQLTYLVENRPPAPPPRPTSDPYLTPDQVNTPNQLEIAIEMKRHEEQKQKFGKSLGFLDKSKSSTHLRIPPSVKIKNLNTKSDTDDDELYIKLQNN